jgi:hypothetical protein
MNRIPVFIFLESTSTQQFWVNLESQKWNCEKTLDMDPGHD